MKKIAIITGASSGMGREFLLTCRSFGEFDEIWAVARREDRLLALQAEAPFPVKPVPLDLSADASYDAFAALLAAEQPEVGLLINASGYGKFDAVMDTPLADNLNMTDLNCKAVMALSQLAIPYMKSGAAILNIASVAAFQPIPWIGVYGATKAFVLSYSRALNRELRSRGIRVMAICPFWTKTEFFGRAVDGGKAPVVKKYAAMYDPKDIVRRAWRDIALGRDVSMYGFVARAQKLLVKLLPHSFVMDIWQSQQSLR